MPYKDKQVAREKNAAYQRLRRSRLSPEEKTAEKARNAAYALKKYYAEREIETPEARATRLEKRRIWQREYDKRVNEALSPEERKAKREENAARARARRAAEPERYRERDKEKYRKNPTPQLTTEQKVARNARLRARSLEQKAREAARMRAWRRQNKERYNEWQKERYAAAGQEEKIVRRVYNSNRKARRRKAPGSVSPKEWRELVARSPRCHWCKRPFNNKRRPTHDHVVPLSRGGVNSIENSVCACSECNSRKHAGRFSPVTGQGILL